MLETDCKIPTTPQPITPPDTYTLYGTARAVQQMLTDGKQSRDIRQALHIRKEHYRDCIFEIRKQEAIGTMAKLEQEKRERIISMRKEGASHAEIMQAVQVGQATVTRVLHAAGLGGRTPASASAAPAQPPQLPEIFWIA